LSLLLILYIYVYWYARAYYLFIYALGLPPLVGSGFLLAKQPDLRPRWGRRRGRARPRTRVEDGGSRPEKRKGVAGGGRVDQSSCSRWGRHRAGAGGGRGRQRLVGEEDAAVGEEDAGTEERGRHRLVEAGAHDGAAWWRRTAGCRREGANVASGETCPAARTPGWNHYRSVYNNITGQRYAHPYRTSVQSTLGNNTSLQQS
jgi:hypothetical protein